MRGLGSVLLASVLAAGASLMVASEEGSERYAVAPHFQRLRFGEVMPAGWLKAQMDRDLREGFAGRLDQLAPEARSDIFVAGRNRPGRINSAVGGGAQGVWWNGETEGNWRAGYIMMAYLSRNAAAMKNADAYVQHILQSQDQDGYIGIYSPELRYSTSRTNGELWTETCILRALLAYYDLTGKAEVLSAVERAVACTMSKYGPGKLTAFPEPQRLGAGIDHGLMFVDVLEQLYDLTGNTAYRNFGLWLYQDYCASDPGTHRDATLVALLDLQKPLVNHGPTTLEHLRVPLWASFVSASEDLRRARENALAKVNQYLLPGGAVVAMEDIGGRKPDPTNTYYEYCAMKELLATLASGLQKTGDAGLGDKIEKLIFNAAEGARAFGGKEITYCTRDNRYRIEGEVGRRSKFSPAHCDLAVCCNPNATQIFPLFVKSMWMGGAEGGLAAMLYGPSSLNTIVKGVKVHIEEETDYPFSPVVSLVISPERPLEFPLQLRNPAWSKDTRVTCKGATARREGNYFIVQKKWKRNDRVTLNFDESIVGYTAANGEIALQRGPLVYALRIPEIARDIKDYSLPGFSDLEYSPAPDAHWSYALDPSLGNGNYGFTARAGKDADNQYPFDQANLQLEGRLINLDSGQSETVQLIPMGSSLAILRRVTFPLGRK